MNSENQHNQDETPEPLDLTPAKLSSLDRKILEFFPGLVVRKDLTKGLKQNAVVPTYVLEYLLGQHCATDDPTALEAGLDSVRKILFQALCAQKPIRAREIHDKGKGESQGH